MCAQWPVVPELKGLKMKELMKGSRFAKTDLHTKLTCTPKDEHGT